MADPNTVPKTTQPQAMIAEFDAGKQRNIVDVSMQTYSLFLIINKADKTVFHYIFNSQEEVIQKLDQLMFVPLSSIKTDTIEQPLDPINVFVIVDCISKTYFPFIFGTETDARNKLTQLSFIPINPNVKQSNNYKILKFEIKIQPNAPAVGNYVITGVSLKI